MSAYDFTAEDCPMCGAEVVVAAYIEHGGHYEIQTQPCDCDIYVDDDGKLHRELTEGKKMLMPIAALQSGIRVGNFSSKHPFVFDDGTELPGCADDRVTGLMLRQEESESPCPLVEGLIDIELTFHMNEPVRLALETAQANEDADIVLVPFPVSKAMAASGMARGKCRGVRMVDRVRKIASATRFCT